jgi:hypothetical protein
MAAPTQASRGRGRPPKKTTTAMARIIEVAKTGLPLHFAAKAGDITDETLLQWRRQDHKFAHDLEAARLEAVERRWKRIEKAAKGTEENPPDWKADAWSLERTYPQFFGRPDIQLSLNQSVSTGPTNTIILGPERARVLATRFQQIRAKTIALFEGQTGNTGNGEGPNQAPPSQPPAELPTFQAVVEEGNNDAPESSRSSAWWRQFVFGKESDAFSKTDAIACVNAVLVELKISIAGTISFPDTTVTNAELQKSLIELTGGDLGWKTLMDLYRRESQREHAQSIWEH